MRRGRFVRGSLLAVLLLATGGAAGAESADELWTAILRGRVDDAGQVAYRSIQVTQAAPVARLIENFTATDTSTLDHDHAVAFWLNAHNAMVIAAVLHGERPETIASRARMFHWFGERVSGARRTVDDVRRILDGYASADPRIHLAICNGTQGSPALAAEAYVADRLDAQLSAAARRFVNDPFRNLLSPGGHVELSRVFEWHRGDFVREHGSMTAFLRASALDAERQLGPLETVLRITYLPFDWRLNAAPGELPR